jgi:hypothetical protein
MDWYYAILVIFGLVMTWITSTSKNDKEISPTNQVSKWLFVTLPCVGFADLYLDLDLVWWMVSITLAVIGVLWKIFDDDDEATATSVRAIQWLVMLLSVAFLTFGIFGAISLGSTWMMVWGGLLLVVTAFALSGIRVALGTAAISALLVTLLVADLLPVVGYSEADFEAAVAEATANRTAELEGQVEELTAKVADLTSTVDDLNAVISARDETIGDLTEEVAKRDATIAERDATITELNIRITELEALLAEKDEFIAQLESDLARFTAGSVTDGSEGSRPVTNPLGVRRLKGGGSEFGMALCVNLNPDGLRGNTAKSYLESISDSEKAHECYKALDDVFDSDQWIAADEYDVVFNDALTRRELGDKFASDPVSFEAALGALREARVSQSLSCLDGRKTTQWFASDWMTILEGVVDRPCERDVVVVSNYDTNGDSVIDVTTYRRTHCGMQRLVPTTPPPPPPTTTTTTSSSTSSTTVVETTTTTVPESTTTTTMVTTTTIPVWEGSYDVRSFCNVDTWTQDVQVVNVEGEWLKFTIAGEEGTEKSFPGDEPMLLLVKGFPADGSTPVVKEVALPGDCIEPAFKPDLVCVRDEGDEPFHRLQFFIKDGQPFVTGVFVDFDPDLDGSVTYPAGTITEGVWVTGYPKYGEPQREWSGKPDDDCFPVETTTTTSTSTTSTSTTSTTSTSTTIPTTTTTVPTTTTTTLPQVEYNIKVELIEIGGSAGGWKLSVKSFDGSNPASGDWQSFHYYPVEGGDKVAFTWANPPTFPCDIGVGVKWEAVAPDGTFFSQTTNQADYNCPTPPPPPPTTTTTTTTTLPPPQP